MGKQEQERRRGKRDESASRHEARQQKMGGGGEWDCIRLPEGVEVFKPEKDQTYHIDVIPYIVGDHNKNSKKGYEYFELSYPVYKNLGVEEKRYIALGELKGERDPVAEHFAILKKSGKDWKTEIMPFKPTWRQLMLVFVHEQADKGLQLFEGAYGTLGEMLDEELKNTEDAWALNFDNPEKGATLKVRFKAQSIGATNPWIRASKIDIIEREDGFTADGNKKLAGTVLDKAAEICLDELLKIPDYATLKKALDGEPIGKGSADDDADEKPTSKGKPAPKDDEGDADEKPAKKKPVDDDEDDADEPPPKKKAAPADDDDEEPAPKKKTPPPDDDDEDDAPPAKAKKPTTAESLGITKGMEVEHKKHGTCTVLRIDEDGTTLKLSDEDDNIHKAVPVTDVTVGNDEDATPAKTGSAKEKPDADGGAGKKGAKATASPSDDDDDEEPAPKKKAAKDDDDEDEKPAKKGSGKSDDWDDDWDDDEPKKKK